MHKSYYPDSCHIILFTFWVKFGETITVTDIYTSCGVIFNISYRHYAPD